MKKLLVLTAFLATPAFALSMDDLANLFPETTETYDIPLLAPLPGRGTVTPKAPTWCPSGLAKSEDELLGDSGFLRRTVLNAGFTEKALSTIAQVACFYPKNDYMQKQTASLMQAYVNIVGITPAQLEQSFKLRVNPDAWDKQKEAFCEAIAPGDEDSKLDISTKLGYSIGSGCQGSGLEFSSEYFDGFESFSWAIDNWQFSNPPELLRSVLILRFLNRTEDGSYDLDLTNENLLTRFPFVLGDITRLDNKKLSEQIKKMPGYNEFARINAEETGALAKVVGEEFSNYYKKKYGNDQGYMDLLFNAPQKAWDNWEKTYSANKVVLDKALNMMKFAMDLSVDSLKTKTSDCSSFESTLRNYVLNSKITSFDQANSVFKEFIPSALMPVVTFCQAAQKRTIEVQYNRDLISESAFWGPREAAYTAALNSAINTAKNRPRFAIKEDKFNEVKRPVSDQGIREAIETLYHGNIHPENDRDVAGQVKTLTPSANGMTKVSFVTLTWVEDTYKCTDTGLIDYIDWNDGKVVYKQNCVYTGKRTVKYTPPPVEVPTAALAGVQAGHYMTFDSLMGAGGSGKAIYAYPKRVYADKDKKILVNFFGYRLR